MITYLGVSEFLRHGLKIGFSYYQPDDDFDHHEFNLFILFILFQIRWEN